MEREAERLFKGIDLQPSVPQPTEAERLRQHAVILRDLADRGMSVRKFRRVAAEQEAKADQLERNASSSGEHSPELKRKDGEE